MPKVLLLFLVCVALGCTTHRTLELDAQTPAIEVSLLGVKFGNKLVQPEEVSEILEDYSVPHDRVIHILLNPEVTDLRPARTLMGYLSRAGYTRPVLVTKRHAASAAPAKKSIRYKNVNE